MVPVYHLAALHTWTDAQNTRGAKAAFYVLHCAPEWICAALLVVPNTRQYFKTGPFGDWRATDNAPPLFKRREKPQVQTPVSGDVEMQTQPQLR